MERGRGRIQLAGCCACVCKCMCMCVNLRLYVVLNTCPLDFPLLRKSQLRLCPGETLHRERSGLTKTCGCLFGFVCKKKPT